MTTHPHDAEHRLPATGAGFIWQTQPFPVLRPIADGIRAAFTTRIGGVSSEPFASLNLGRRVGDDPDDVGENESIARTLIDAAGRWAPLHQVHGADVVRARPPGERCDADAAWTDDPGDALAVKAADCAPVLLCGDRRVAVAHAGWRGLVAGVVENAIEEARATQLFIGPAIGPCCFEVGAEVVEAFDRTYPTAVMDATHVDLWAAAEAAGRKMDVREINAARLCTSCHPELFFSHRRDKGRTGRQALLARLRDD